MEISWSKFHNSLNSSLNFSLNSSLCLICLIDCITFVSVSKLYKILLCVWYQKIKFWVLFYWKIYQICCLILNYKFMWFLHILCRFQFKYLCNILKGSSVILFIYLFFLFIYLFIPLIGWIALWHKAEVSVSESANHLKILFNSLCLKWNKN